MSFISETIRKVLNPASPAELRVMRERDFTSAEDTARWLVDHCTRGFTPTQREAIAFQMLQELRAD